MTNNVDWDFARSVAGRIADRHQIPEGYDVQSIESDFLELTEQAAELVEAETGLVSTAGPARARLADRMGWIDSNLASFNRLLRPLLERIEDEDDGESKRFSESDLVRSLGPIGEFLGPVSDTIGDAAGKVSDTVGPKVAGAEVGALLGWMSGRVLGQYDLLIVEDDRPEDQDWVYYVGPNIASMEKKYGFPAREFRLWIAVHECTHRAQFTGVPWLRPYFLSLVNELLDTVNPDMGRLVDALREAVADRQAGRPSALSEGGLSALLATPEQRATMDKVTGLMSLLEGHGDITMDRAAKDLIPSQPRFAKVMSDRRNNSRGLTKIIQRLTGMEAKLAQYEEGEAFILAVEGAGGRELFDQVWTGPEALPTIEEIRAPQLWIDRIGAPSGV